MKVAKKVKPSSATRNAASTDARGRKLELFRVSGPEGHRYEYMYLGPKGPVPADDDDAPAEEPPPIEDPVEDEAGPIEESAGEPSSSSGIQRPREPDHPPPNWLQHQVDGQAPQDEQYSEADWQSWRTMQQAIKSSKKSGRSKGHTRMLRLWERMEGLRAAGEWIGDEPDALARDARLAGQAKSRPGP